MTTRIIVIAGKHGLTENQDKSIKGISGHSSKNSINV